MLPIAGHHTVAAGNNFTHGLAIVGHVLVFEIHDTQFYSWIGIASHGLKHVALFGFARDVRLEFRRGERG
jgi:hypothetical protein